MITVSDRMRFHETLRFGKPDRVPLFSEGMREKVLENWRSQGYLRERSLSEIFHFDLREEISFELPSNIDYFELANRSEGLLWLEIALDSQIEDCMPTSWLENVARWNTRSHVLMLMVHWGFFQTMGVHDWKTFTQLIYLLADAPNFVRDAMELNGIFASKLVSKFFDKVDVDSVIFSEPIGGDHGSLISPKMYRDIAMAGYLPILKELNHFEVDIAIWRTYANTNRLIPIVKEVGINTIWACESNPEVMDYIRIREQYGDDLALIGGFDLDLLRYDKVKIRTELESKLPLLLAQGGYIPLADGRVREDIPFENYEYYRRLLEKMVMKQQ